MTRSTRTRLLLAVGGFVALTIFLPSTMGASFPGGQPLSSDMGDRVDLGAALRVALGSEVATIVSAPFERVWSKASNRGRFSLPVVDAARAALTRAALVVALVLTTVVTVRTTQLAANTSDTRAPPLLLQRQ